MVPIPSVILNYVRDIHEVKRARRESTMNAERVANYFFKNPEILDELTSEDHYLLSKKIHREANGADVPAIVKLFDQKLVSEFTDEDLEMAILERNYDLAFEYLDKQNFVSYGSEYKITRWLNQVVPKDLAFYRFVGKVQLTLKGDQIDKTSLVGHFYDQACAFFSTDLESKDLIESQNCPMDLLIYSHVDKWGAPLHLNVQLLAQLLNKEVEGFKLTLDDLKTIKSSNYLKRIIFHNREIFLLINQYADHLSEWYSARQRSPETHFVIEAAIKENDLKMLDLLNLDDLKNKYQPYLLRINYPPEFQELILSKLDLKEKEVLRDGSPETIEYFYKKYPDALNDRQHHYLMTDYLENKQFSVDLFHKIFKLEDSFIESIRTNQIIIKENQVVIRNYDNDSLFESLLKRQPSVILDILEKFKDEIPMDQAQDYLYTLITRSNIFLHTHIPIGFFQFCYPGEEIHEVLFDFINSPNYKPGDLQKLIEAYPNLRNDLKNILDKEDYTHNFKNKLSYPHVDIIDIFKDDRFSRDDTILHIIASFCSIKAFFDYLPADFDPKRLHIRNNFQDTPLVYATINADISKIALKTFLSYGSYSQLFSGNSQLLNLALYGENYFRRYLEREPHLKAHFQHPVEFATSDKDAMQQDLDVDALHRLLSTFSENELIKLQEKGFSFDPLMKGKTGNTLYHVHPCFYNIPKDALNIENDRGETPLWNPNSRPIVIYLRRGSNPEHLSKNGSNFLHSLNLNPDQLEDVLLSLPLETRTKLLFQPNHQGKIPFKILGKSFDHLRPLLKYLDITNPKISVMMLNQILMLQESNRVRNRTVPIPEQFQTLKEKLTQNIVSNIDLYKPFLSSVPYVFTDLLIHHEELFKIDELIAALDHDAPPALVEWFFSHPDKLSLTRHNDPEWFWERSFDDLVALMPILPPDFMPTPNPERVSNADLEELDLYLAKVLSNLERIESDWINWFNTTQEELKTITIEQTAILTKIRTDAIWRLLPYFHPIQLAVIIPLLPQDKLNSYLAEYPYDKLSELLLYATSDQKLSFLQNIELLPVAYRNSNNWKKDSLEDFTSTYFSLVKDTPLEDGSRKNMGLAQLHKLQKALLQNSPVTLQSQINEKFYTLENRMENIQNEAKKIYTELSLKQKNATVEIPEHFYDASTYDLLEIPIRIPPLEPARWIDLKTWERWQKDESERKDPKVGPDEIRHPVDLSIVKISEFKPDPQLARDIAKWKKDNNVS